MNPGPSTSGTVGRDHEPDPLVHAGRVPTAGLTLVGIGHSTLGVWQLLTRQLTQLHQLRPEVATVTVELDDPGDQQLAEATCDRHDLDVLPCFLLYEDGQLAAVQIGATNAERLATFASRT